MKILAYSEANLAVALSNKKTTPEIVKLKKHFSYFKKYLESPELNVKTILLEEGYISRDYLHDYASYYALCYEQYEKVCRRVHFFDNEVTEDEFKKIIIQPVEDQAEFWKHYMGFIVVKPLPSKMIGYTVLKTYSNSQNYSDRNFWGLRQYTINLYGNKITLESLAFQEQDSVLAACATMAVWSMLNKAAVDFHTVLKSPSQITNDADNVSPDGSRLFPNNGLSIQQISQAILASGLVSEIKDGDFRPPDRPYKVITVRYLKKIINAYSGIGIPIILVVRVPSGGSHGLHAITVSGFKVNQPLPILPQKNISYMSDNIDRIYAHDDQWGPFARINLSNDYDLETPWTEFDKEHRPTVVTSIVVSLYPKIRISYQDLEVIVVGLDLILTLFFKNHILADLVWDIKIEFSEKYKTTLKNSSLDDTEKVEILAESMPKYIWVATCHIGEHKLFCFTFDATNVNHAMIGLQVISFLPDKLQQTLKQFLIKNRETLQFMFKHMASEKYYEFLINKLK
ncbi:hypothetical protein D0C36_16295 [Mucilaginibacter conchicola]|uniref:Uncharacterized protein n=1 Tax=Mucilaginibacter conchicola TaxID=2303333 RepID=A0A372NUM3_9SPHI|nr:hypothetical protein [Mucilaginibacter conchicola]RFZ92948.1 hypothetical protein D0C36_16295 [Mucilaginibacter conchicola]